MGVEWKAAVGLLFLVCANAVPAQADLDIQMEQLGARAEVFRSCVFSYATKNARSRESAGDIADAALAYCVQAREDMSSLMHAYGWSPFEVRANLAIADKAARGDALLKIIAARKRAR